MKKFLITAALLLGLRLGATQFYYNPFTTNDPYDALNLATNIATGAIQGSITASLSPGVIEAAGGLDTNNYANYADTNGAAAYLYSQATNYAATNLPANLVTSNQLVVATNALVTNEIAAFNTATNGLVTASVTNGLASTNYVNAATNGFVTAAIISGLASLTAVTNEANAVYSNNPSSYLTPSATNNITAFGSNVVTQIQNGQGIVVASYSSASGITVSLTATGTNNVNVTNLNATSLASYGALTTNSSSWSAYVAPINDYTNAKQYTNGLLPAATAAATYQPVGTYLTSSNNLNYNNVTNQPAIPTTNGFVTAAIISGLATTNYVNAATNGFVTAAIISGLATTNYVNAATNGFVTAAIISGLATTNWVLAQNYTNAGILSNYTTLNSLSNSLNSLITSTGLNSESNSLQTQISSNATAITQTWPISQPFVGVIALSSNMTVSFVTNAGVITATLGSYGGAVTGFQPASANLTNWSGVPTNTILLTTNVVTSITQNTGATVQGSTNANGITYTIGSGVDQTSVAWQSGTFITPAHGTQIQQYFSHGLACSAPSLEVYYNGTGYSSGGNISLAFTYVSSSSCYFTFTDNGTIPTNVTVTVIAFCE